MTARKRLRDFERYEVARRTLCSLSPRWAAEDQPPPGLPEYEKDVLCTANWVKRRWLTQGPSTPEDQERRTFPSTSSIASAPFRRRVLARLSVREVRRAVQRLQLVVPRGLLSREAPVPGLVWSDELGRWLVERAGPWVYPDAWQREPLEREYGMRLGPGVDFGRAADEGGRAAHELVRVMDEAAEVEAPTPYLALLAQDVDGMGRYMSGQGAARDGATLAVSPARHREVSQRLGDLGRWQSEELQGAERHGVPVYAGGDDLLAFVPAASALEAAQACHDGVPADLPTVSSAVLFFHRRGSLRLAVAEVQALLHEAKRAEAGKHALAVGYLRRSGVREQSVQPWESRDGRSAADLFGVFRRRDRASLSPRLVSELERDGTELDTLSDELYAAELARLVARHHGRAEDSDALLTMGGQERARPGTHGLATHAPATRTPVAAARVAVFLRQECR